MTMMEFALLERRREINRKAARKSRSRQKELANQIRKKYYEAQSANTKLVYERKCLVRERDELSSELREHRRSCPNCTVQSSEECFDGLPDDDDLQQPRTGIQIQTRRSTYHKIPSSVLIASPPLSRSLSCPESSAAANLSQLQYTEDAEDNIVLSSTSDEDEDDDDEEEEENEEVEKEEEEIEKYDEPTNAVFSPDYFSFTDLGIAETTTSSSAVRDAPSSSDPMALIGDESLNVFHFEDQTDFLVAIEGDEDPFSLLDDMLPSSSMNQVFGRSVTTDPTTFSKPSSSAGVEFTRITGFGSNQTISTATVRDLVDDATGTYCDDQQSEAIDLSKPRAKLPTTDLGLSSVRAATSMDAKLIRPNEQKVPEPAAINANVGNIPLHVHNFIVGEK